MASGNYTDSVQLNGAGEKVEGSQSTWHFAGMSNHLPLNYEM